MYLISRRGYNEPFQVRWSVPLGPGPAASDELNLRYVARGESSNGKDTWEFGRKRSITALVVSVDVTSQACTYFA